MKSFHPKQIWEIFQKLRKNTLFRQTSSFIGGASIVYFIITDCICPYEVSGSSMYPSLENRDFIFVSKWKSWFPFIENRGIHRGDVAVFKSSTSKDEIIKRIIALEGDCVVPRNKMLQQRWKSDPHLPLGGEAVEEFVSYFPVQVPKGHVWIEGDNAPQSKDSNSYGTIPLALLVGTASFIFWPISRIGFIPKVDTKDRVIPREVIPREAIPREVTLDKEQ